MMTKNDMNNLVRMSFIGACLGFGVVAAFALTLV